MFSIWLLQKITANKNKCKEDDFFAFQRNGTYEISIAGKLNISNTCIALPDIVVHVPRTNEYNLTMANVADCLNTILIAYLGLMAEQLVELLDLLTNYC